MPHRRLEEQLEYLRQHYQVLPLDDALQRLWNDEIDGPTAAITFDDGYRNNLTIAAPLLAKHRLPATIYLATGLLGTRARLWTTEVDLVFEDTPVASADLAPVGLGTVLLRTPAERSQACAVVKQRLKTLTDDDRAHAISAIKQALGTAIVDPSDDFALMSWHEVQQMAQDGLTTFGGHTVNHVILSRSSDEAVASEIRASVTDVRDRSNAVSETFAYPNGRRVDFDGRAQDALRALGVRAAVTTIEGLNDRHTDRFALRRVAVGDDMTLADFKLRTSGFLPALRERFGREPDA
ncbi:MAG TPA: polysaccharide deacetylase family protein [Gemmatimonadaceae bacterium]|nr:polysaccharide deacetylase family protein [Gemmatimonadaceae bacterium]